MTKPPLRVIKSPTQGRPARPGFPPGQGHSSGDHLAKVFPWRAENRRQEDRAGRNGVQGQGHGERAERLARSQAGEGEDSFIQGQPRSGTAELAQAQAQDWEGISSGSLPRSGCWNLPHAFSEGRGRGAPPGKNFRAAEEPLGPGRLERGVQPVLPGRPRAPRGKEVNGGNREPVGETFLGALGWGWGVKAGSRGAGVAAGRPCVFPWQPPFRSSLQEWPSGILQLSFWSWQYNWPGVRGPFLGFSLGLGGLGGSAR